MDVKPASHLTNKDKEQLNNELLPVLNNVQVYKDTFDLLVFTYRTPTATYTFKILPKTSPDATVTPGNWGGSENTDLTPDRDGL